MGLISRTHHQNRKNFIKKSQIHQPSVKMVKAVAVLRGDSNVKGTVTFEQASEGADTTVSWNISGHDANAERGMHVHAFGDNTNGCTSAGPHFNPHHKTHGQGNAQGSVTDKLVKLIGPESVLGRTVVVR